LMTEQKKSLVEDMQKRMEQQGFGDAHFEEYKQKWDADFEQTASYMIQSSFLIDKLASDQNLRATSADVDAKFNEYAAQTGIELSRLKEFYGEQERMSRLSYQITEEKVIAFLISKAKVQEVSKEELEKENTKN
jgi:trigger factor